MEKRISETLTPMQGRTRIGSALRRMRASLAAALMVAGLMAPACAVAQNAIGALLSGQTPETVGTTPRTAPPAAAADAGFQPITINGGDGPEAAAAAPVDARGQAGRAASQPGEFQNFVTQMVGRPLPRFGASLVGDSSAFASPATAVVPPDYRLNTGDTIAIGLTGSVEGSLVLTIDSNGRVFVPRVGAVNVGGVRYGDLETLLRRSLGREFREFQVSVTVGQLRGIQVYVTGYVASPGAYTVSSLSTLTNAVLAAGGPTTAGSFRNIVLRRRGQEITTLDLYELLLNGDKSRDAVLQNEDVIFVGPTGSQVAITGSVNYEGVFEARPGETYADIVRYAGGTNTIADTSRYLLARIANIGATGWEQIAPSQALATAEPGSILRVLSSVGVLQPIERQAVLVTIDGEVERPGNYYLQPGSTMADLLAEAGSFTPRAYLYGLRFSRESVRAQQQGSFDQAISDLSLALAALPIQSFEARTDHGIAQIEAAKNLLTELRARRPDGRIIFDVTQETPDLPLDLALENSDRVNIPPRPVTVGVFGAVYRPGSFLEERGKTIGDYVRQAGGGRELADDRNAFLVRANGSVISAKQFGRKQLMQTYAYPGDVVFIPVRTQGNVFWERLGAIVATVYQLTLGAVLVESLTN